MSINSLPQIQQTLRRILIHTPHLIGALASSDASDRARVRMIVIRHFDLEHMTIRISTDIRSSKVAQLAQKPTSELCLWLSDQNISLRMLTTWSVIQARRLQERNSGRLQTFWESHSASSKALFLSAPPGDHYQPATVSETPTQVPITFAELVGHIDEIDALEIHQGAQIRWRHVRQPPQTWTSVQLNP